jgi:hypothetical protein
MIQDIILLRSKLINAVKSKINVDSNPSISNLEEGILWFERILNYNTGINGLDGINSTLMHSLDTLYVKNNSPKEALTSIASEIETFLEKVFFLVKGVDYTTDKSKTLINMIEELELSSIIKDRGMSATDYFNEERIIELTNTPEFSEHIARTYICRNELVHNSPGYDPADILIIARSFLIVMIFSVLKHLDKIKLEINTNIDKLSAISNLTLIDDKTKVFYNFISHGNPAREIKEQVVEAFVLHTLLEKGELSPANLRLQCNDSFGTNFTDNSFERVLYQFGKDDKVEKKQNGLFTLTESEKELLEREVAEFAFAENLFKQNIQEALSEYYLEEKTDLVYLELNKLIEANYKIDLNEIFNDVVSGSSSISIVLSNFKNFLQDILKSRGKDSESNLNDLALQLLSICQNNSFLYRKCASTVFSDLSKQNELQAYVRQQNRDVYLDTNVLLYVICRYYTNLSNSEIPEYNIVKDLLDIEDKDRRINLYTYEEYVLELSYQIRAAILLIPFEEVNFFSDGYSSSNVFFNFYNYLSSKGRLEDDDDTFEDFLNALGFYYDDLFDRDPLSTIAEICDDILKEEHIRVKSFHYKDTKQNFDHFSSLAQGRRSPITIANDVQMIYFLNDKKNHDLEPYFVTYDSLFFSMREYVLKGKSRNQFWHLYYPSRFVAHLNLLEFKIDSRNLTNGFMSILTKNNFVEETQELADVMSSFMDIRTENKRKLIEKLKEFNKKYVYKISETVNAEIRSDKNSVGELLKQISYHYRYGEKKKNLLDVKRFLLDEKNVKIVTELFEHELKIYSEKGSFSDDLFNKIDELMKK